MDSRRIESNCGPRIAGRVRQAAALAAVAWLAACTTGPFARGPFAARPAPEKTAAAPTTTSGEPRPSEVRTVTIAGGESVRVPIEHGDVQPAENSDIRIEVAGFVADRSKQAITFMFGFREKKMEWPRAVQVEDVTGDDAELLVSDDTPGLSRDGIWRGMAAPLRKGDPGLAWLSQPGDTFKIFRLTITMANGRKLVMFQAAIWGEALKATFRELLGYDAPPAAAASAVAAAGKP